MLVADGFRMKAGMEGRPSFEVPSSTETAGLLFDSIFVMSFFVRPQQSILEPRIFHCKKHYCVLICVEIESIEHTSFFTFGSVLFFMTAMRLVRSVSS